jgi:anti-sigma regulatory factor (Ser/Thr protein kinase)
MRGPYGRDGFGDQMSTLICQVSSRLPVATVSLFGTLDRSSAVRMTVCLRDCLAEQPTVLLLDVEHLVVAAQTTLTPLLNLADDVRLWPGTRIELCSPSTEILNLIPADAPIGSWASVAAGTEAAHRVPVPPRRSLALRPEASAPAEAREFARETCAEWGIERVTTLAELVTSELVTNAVVHARTHVDLTVRLIDDTLSIAVRDADPRPMFRPNESDIDQVTAEHGRGLLLLDAMADAWGSHPTGDGKIVWATIGVTTAKRQRS